MPKIGIAVLVSLVRIGLPVGAGVRVQGADDGVVTSNLWRKRS
jgi:hypothetical protein